MKKSMRQIMIMCLMVLIAGVIASFGKERDYKLLNMETYMEMESIRSPNISPDGKHILFTRGWVDKMNDEP